MKLSDAEWKVMRTVWQQPGCTVREVTAATADETEWSYSTVKTLLSRLEEKGAVAVDRSEASSRYRPLIAENEARKSALRGFLERTFDGTIGALVHHLVAEEKLSRSELAELKALLAAESAKEDAEPEPR
jgi:BlaI family transcriptional regulator, penicillinase repressor